jgi:hypothetical protein
MNLPVENISLPLYFLARANVSRKSHPEKAATRDKAEQISTEMNTFLSPVVSIHLKKTYRVEITHGFVIVSAT